MLKSFRHAGIFRLALVGAVLAGFVLALALAASPELHERLHHAAGHEEHQCLATLIGGVAVMLVWAGFVEAFLSQYHEPVIPYWVKIAFGCTELAVLVWFLRSGRAKDHAAAAAEVRA